MAEGQGTAEFPRFSDFADEKKRLEGTGLKVADILNKEILITGYSIDPSKFPAKDGSPRNRLALEFILDGEKHVTFTGSEVLMALIEKYPHKIPFYATITPIDRYYTLK
ncbi:MAG: hypothetical protein WC262_09845 [Bacteroidales bacterium]|jgi:hypothetical protein